MKKLVFYILLAIWSAIPAVVFAQENKWQDEAELSYVNTSGNTDVLSLSAKNKLTYQFSDRLSGLWDVRALYGKTDGDKSAERYATEIRLDYGLTERVYIAGIGGWLQDEFAGIDERLYLGPALGYKFIIGPKHFLNAEAGLEYVTENYTNNTDDNFMRGRALGLYEFLLSEKSKVTQSIEYLYDFDNSDNYNINTVTALITSLSDTFSIKTSYEIHYDNEPVPDSLDETDTILSVALVVNMK
jgi:putative salt-induced outer membrane protein